MNEAKKQQVIALGRLGWSLRRIQKSTGIRRETAAAYLREAGVALRPPGAWGRAAPAKPANEVATDPGAPVPANGSSADPLPAKPAIKVTTDFGAEMVRQPGRSPSASACEIHREAIQVGLSQGRNAMAIWQDLVDVHGFTGGYGSVKRFVRKLRGKPSPEARAVIETAPGEEAQVDYGAGPMVRDVPSGKYRRTRLFVLTLGYSRALNPLYRDVLKHYNTVPLPCRVADPNRKGKVERGVGHAKNTPLKGLRFESLAEAQTHLDHWEERWADTRIHGTTKRQVAAMFAEERSTLQPLPIEPFRYYQYGVRTVHLDGCVEVEAAYYGAPPGWIGRRVQVQWDSHRVRLLDPAMGELLREHLRQGRGGHRIQDEDRPKKTPLSTLGLLSRAGKAGSQIGARCRGMHGKEGEMAVRRILGMLSLVKKYGPATVEDACTAALEMGVGNYRFVRRYLERNPQLPLSLRQVDPLIRQLTLYRDFIENKTKETKL